MKQGEEFTIYNARDAVFRLTSILVSNKTGQKLHFRAVVTVSYATNNDVYYDTINCNSTTLDSLLHYSLIVNYTWSVMCIDHI